MAKTEAPLFRAQALRHSSGRSEGEVLHLSSRVTGFSYWVLVFAFVVSVFYCVFGTIHEYADGPAVVWVEGRLPVTTAVAGTVSEILVRPGQRVEVGQILTKLQAAAEMAEVDRIQREFDLELIRTLRDPSDLTARATLSSLLAQKELVLSRLSQLTIKASQAGVVGDVRIHVGQRLAAGDVVVTQSSALPTCSIVAMLPAHYRPQLKPGMVLTFEATGYRYAYQEMTISSVGAEIIGPAEVKRFLGHEIDDTLQVSGPVVMVEATPPSAAFVVDGQSFDYFHGMNGTVLARVRSERILFALIPGLRLVFEKLYG